MTGEDPICLVDTCDRPTPHGRVCFSCVDAARVRMDEITDTQLYDLRMIARRHAAPANPNAIPARRSRPGPRDVLDAAVYSLLEDYARWDDLLPNLHRKASAPRILEAIHTGCDTIDRLTLPQDERLHPDDYIADQMDRIHLLQPKALVLVANYLFKMRLGVHRIYDWRRRGLITPRHVSLTGETFYHLVDVLYALDAMERKPALR